MQGFFKWVLPCFLLYLGRLVEADTFEAMPTFQLGTDYDIDLVDVNTTALANGFDVSSISMNEMGDSSDVF